MFTVNEANLELQKYNSYTSYNIPQISNIEYDDSAIYFGQIQKEEILCENIFIHLSKNINDCPLEYQKSVLWHEFTHIYDLLQFKEYPENILNGIMKTYSESHAKSIQLRYLLHISPKQIVNQGKRFLYSSNGKADLGSVTANFLNQSMQGLIDFQTYKNPENFNDFTNGFCYFCGYMMLKKRTDADKLVSCVTSKYPRYSNELQLLYQSIIDKNFNDAAIIYNKIRSEAMLESFNGIFQQ